MHDSAMDLTTLANRTDLMTLITEREAGFLRVQQYSLHLLKGENALLVKVKGKKHVLLHEEKIQDLKGIPKISVIPEEMSLHHPEMNLEKQTGVKYEGNEKRGEL